MATRWEVENAVMQSHIDPGGRHILLTLLAKTNSATAEIPPKHVPTFDELATMTGISKSTVTEWMKTLSEANWISRESVPGESRKCIRLAEGDPKAARVMRVRKAKDVDAAYRVAVREDRPSGEADVPPRGTSRTATRYTDVPPRGMPDEGHLLKGSSTKNLDPVDRDQSAASADDAPSDGTLGVDFGEPAGGKGGAKKRAPRKGRTTPEEVEENKRLHRVTKLYTDRVMSHWHKSREVVKTAFNYNFTEEQISAGLTKLADAKDPLTIDSLRIAIQGNPSWASNNNQPRSGSRESNRWQPPASDDEYDKPFSGAVQ